MTKSGKLSQEERNELKRIPTDEKFYLDTTGAPALTGEVGYTPNELTGARPTLDVNGLSIGIHRIRFEDHHSCFCHG